MVVDKLITKMKIIPVMDMMVHGILVILGLVSQKLYKNIKRKNPRKYYGNLIGLVVARVGNNNVLRYTSIMVSILNKQKMSS